MDTNTPPTRTPAQTAASRVNGAAGNGPVTPAGKAISSANGTTHGLASRGVLLPSEHAADYEANLNDWFTPLVPRSPGEGHLVARVADVGWRMGRLSRLEERMVNAALERQFAESAPVKARHTAQEALQAVRSVATLAEEVKTPRPAEGVARIASGLRFVSALLGKTDIPVIVVATFEQAVTLLTAASYQDGLHFGTTSGASPPAMMVLLARGTLTRWCDSSLRDGIRSKCLPPSRRRTPPSGAGLCDTSMRLARMPTWKESLSTRLTAPAT